MIASKATKYLLRAGNMQLPSGIRVLSLDAMNTTIRLRQPPGRTYTEFAKSVGITADELRVSADFVKAFKRLEHEKPCYAHAQGGARHWWTCVVRSAFASVEADPSKMDELSLMLYDYYSTTDAWTLVDEQITNHLQRLRQAANLKIAVTSNFDSRLRPILEDLGVSEHVDFIALSGEVGAQKPQPGIFAAVANYFSILPEVMLHIGDSIDKDFLAAGEFGALSLLLHNEAEPLRDERVPKVCQIRSLFDLNV